MKLIYIAGPYRAPTEFGVAENIRRAEALAIEVWKLGAACICPHKNTAFMGGVVPDEVFLEGAVEMLSQCDAVLCTDNWRQSEGAVNEIALADRWGYPVFEDIAALKMWLEDEEAKGIEAARQAGAASGHKPLEAGHAA